MSSPGLGDYLRLARRGGLFRAWSFFRETQLFDLVHGTDTAHWRPKHSFSSTLSNVAHGYHYEASYTSEIRRCLALVSGLVRLSDYEFHDLGCGKGKALLVAGRCGFARVTGVEYDPDLVRIARANLARTGTAATVVEADAAGYREYHRHQVVYLFNPFDADLLRQVLARITDTVEDCIVVYTNPVHAELFAHWTPLTRTHGRHSSLVSHLYRWRRSPGRAETVPGA